jgi:hypothetical protein
MPLIGTFAAGSARGFGETAGARAPYNIDYLVIAGGASGGGSYGAGGGGAGGYRNSYGGESSGGGASAETNFECEINAVYTVTVGAGGTPENNGRRFSTWRSWNCQSRKTWRSWVWRKFLSYWRWRRWRY